MKYQRYRLDFPLAFAKTRRYLRGSEEEMTLRKRKFFGTSRSRRFLEFVVQAINIECNAWAIALYRPERYEYDMVRAQGAHYRQKQREMVNPARRFPRLTMSKAEEERAFGFLRVKR
jgi:hypothetical protein